MKRDMLRELLGESATPEVIDAIMRENGKDVEDVKSRLDKMATDYNNLKKASEQSVGETDDLKAQVEEARKEAAKAIHALSEQSAIATFAAAGISEEECKPFLASVVGPDRKTTIANAKAIADLVSSRADAAREKAKLDALGGMGQPAGGQPAGAVTTREEFLKLPYSQQLELKEQNPDILKQLS
jgi:nanoRNase/pAp phosphatase (c-di-AMP/oligoRNAs hydrolase)